jgi:hypothetical protein
MWSACTKREELITEKAEWSYARWQMPGDDQYESLPAKASAWRRSLTWFRTTFKVKPDRCAAVPWSPTG